MTDQYTPDLPQGPYTLDDIWLARDWAAHILKTPGASIPMEQSAARVLRALLPPPPRPTLADMTEAEREVCQWMQADVYDTKGEWVIRESPHSNAVQLVNRHGKCLTAAAKDVTPRPDLPRMTWPGDQQPSPALPEGWRLADHEKYGLVVVTNTTPDIDGHVYFVAPAPGVIGNDWHICIPAELTYLDTTPAPSPSTLAVGSEWDDADALARACEESGRDQIVVLEADGYAFVWDKAAEWWEGSMPPQFIPLTILHTGREAADAVD